MEPEAEVIMSMGPTLHSLSAIDFHKDISKEVLDCTAQLKDLDINSSAADRYTLRELEQIGSTIDGISDAINGMADLHNMWQEGNQASRRDEQNGNHQVQAADDQERARQETTQGRSKSVHVALVDLKPDQASDNQMEDINSRSHTRDVSSAGVLDAAIG